MQKYYQDEFPIANKEDFHVLIIIFGKVHTSGDEASCCDHRAYIIDCVIFLDGTAWRVLTL